MQGNAVNGTAAALQALLHDALCSACVSERLRRAQVLSLKGSVRCRVSAYSSLFKREIESEGEDDRHTQRVSIALCAGGRWAKDGIHATAKCPIGGMLETHFQSGRFPLVSMGVTY